MKSDKRLLRPNLPAENSDGSFLLWDLSTNLVSAIPQPVVAFKPPYCDDYITDYVILPERSTRDDVFFAFAAGQNVYFANLNLRNP